jgi:hypothetical protein
MKHADLPKVIQDTYESEDVRFAKVDTHGGEPRYVVTLFNGDIHIWKDSIKKGWKKVKHHEVSI